VSAPEHGATGAGEGVWLADCATDVVDVGAYALSSADARRRVGGVELTPFGRCASSGGHLVVSVRPARWLLLSPPASPGSAAARWERNVQGQAAVTDMSAALAACVLAGPRAREMLTRGCRLDLSPAVFGPGEAAATIMAQVSVTLAALPECLLLLTPASTARHFREWLAGTAAPFGLVRAAPVSLSELSGDRAT